MNDLVLTAAIMAGIDSAMARRASLALLGLATEPSPSASGCSELNWNGSPLQLLFTLRKNRAGVRLLADPGFHLTDAAARFAAGQRSLAAVLALADASALQVPAQRTLAIMVPPDPEALARYAAGSMWLALALGTPGAALYVGPDPREARWARVQDWVRAITPEPAAALTLIEALENCASFLLGVGIEGAQASTLRFKIYWRMTQAVPLSAYPIDPLQDPAVLHFLARALGQRTVTPDTLNFSAAFVVTEGALCDVKVDVSWHGRQREDALQLLSSTTQQLGLASAPARTAIALTRQFELEIGCIGLGLDTAADYRLNTYLFQP